MTWVRENLHRVALSAGALFVAGCAFFIWRSAAGFEKNFVALQPAGLENATAPLPNAIALESGMQMLASPPLWTFAGRSGLFVPEKHFIGPNGFPATLQTTEVHPPVPNDWLDRFGLPIAEADVLTQDSDGDGYSNLEEWENKTDPIDKESHPPFVAKLKMKSYTREPFRLVFSSRTGDTFGINTSDLTEPTQFLRVGETIRGTTFKIVDFEEKFERNRYGTEVDVSELTLENQENNERFNLVKEKIMVSPESIATFAYLWGEGREFQVKKDHQFSLPPETEIRYKLIDVQPGKAVIVNTQKPNEEIVVRPLDSSENP